MSSSDEDKPKAKRPKRKSSRKKSKKEKRQGKQENENTQVECKNLIKKAGGSTRMKASRADGCVKIKVVGVSGRTHGRKASIDNEKKSVERKEKESTCVMETEGYSDISVMEKEGNQKPIMENISVMEKEGNQKAVMENLTVTEKGGHQDTVMENHSVMEKSVSSDPVPPVGSTCKEVMTKKEGDQTTVMENQNVMEKSVSIDPNASGTVLDIPFKNYVM